jgi:hypothetical protein
MGRAVGLSSECAFESKEEFGNDMFLALFLAARVLYWYLWMKARILGTRQHPRTQVVARWGEESNFSNSYTRCIFQILIHVASLSFDYPLIHG